jgi:hypothetical protein
MEKNNPQKMSPGSSASWWTVSENLKLSVAYGK